MNKIEEGIAANDTAIATVKNGYLPLSGGTVTGNLQAGSISVTDNINGGYFSSTGINLSANNSDDAISIEKNEICFADQGAIHFSAAADSILTGISDSKGTSSTLALSQKGASDNYFPLTGGTITNDTTIMGSTGQYGIKFTDGDIQFLSDGGATVRGTITGISSSKGTSTTRAMSEKGVADNYLPLTGGTITGTLKLTADIGNEIVLRFDSGNYASGINYRTSGNEAMCFENKNQVSSFIFRTFDPSAATDAWNGVVPSMQIKNQKVTINKIIAEGAEAAYNLDVNGTVNGTTLYENGASISSKYLPKADLPSNLLKYQIITSTSDIGTDANTAYLILE